LFTGNFQSLIFACSQLVMLRVGIIMAACRITQWRHNMSSCNDIVFSRKSTLIVCYYGNERDCWLSVGLDVEFNVDDWNNEKDSVTACDITWKELLIHITHLRVTGISDSSRNSAEAFDFRQVNQEEYWVEREREAGDMAKIWILGG